MNNVTHKLIMTENQNDHNENCPVLKVAMFAGMLNNTGMISQDV
jgi:hypothetical protein